MNQRQLFLNHVAQTSPSPLAIEIKKASGSLVYDAKGKEYIDLIAGISVCNIGHCHPKVAKAIKKQVDEYLHVLVYGEMIETPQVQYARLLTANLPSTLNSVYFTTSGAEAVEGAMKLAKRVTGRRSIVAFNKSYHGSTQGALSVMGDENWRNSFRPLLPGIDHVDYNAFEDLDRITSDTACVIAETVQAERGVIPPTSDWMQALRKRCDETGALLILDAIQTGFGRTGQLWGFEQHRIIPDILLLGKALGGGMPLGAFISNRDLMQAFTHNPVLGHITTFGGHPVCCAAGLAAMKVLLKDDLISEVNNRAKLFVELLQHQQIIEVRTQGLLISIEFDSWDINKKVIDHCIREGVLTDWFLFAPNCLRIAPPLNIPTKLIKKACAVIIEGCNKIHDSKSRTTNPVAAIL
jgi:acetylornithine/N-succinyldiaminopimelate aminotransferase